MNNALMQPMTEQEVMDVMHTHDIYRKMVAKWHQDHTPDWVPTTLQEQKEQRNFDRPLMSDKEFLEKLQGIVTLQFPYVKTDQVSEIYQLRALYECLPANKNGEFPRYNPATVRLQCGAAQKRREQGRSFPNDILPLSDEIQKEIWGTTTPHMLWFDLRDVLRHELGRWRLPKYATMGLSKPVSPSYQKAISDYEKRTGDRALDYEAVAEQFGVTTRTVYRWVKTQKIPTVHLENGSNKHGFILQSEIERRLQEKPTLYRAHTEHQ